MTEPTATIGDQRRPAFCFQTHEALDVIRGHFTGAKLVTALAVYLVFTEAANRTGGSKARGGFRVTRTSLAKMAGISVDTLDRYVAVFEQLGLLNVVREKIGDANLPNRWVLSDAPPSRTDAARVAAPVSPLARDPLTEPKKPSRKELVEQPLDAVPKLVKVDGRNLGFDALCKVCGIDPNGNRGGQVGSALNGGKGISVGIRELVWRAICDGDVTMRGAVVDPETIAPHFFELIVEQAIKVKAAEYRETMGDAILTPTALAKWWTDLGRVPRGTPTRYGRGMTTREMLDTIKGDPDAG